MYYDFLYSFCVKYCETFPILRTERDIIVNAHMSSRKVPVILVRF